MSDELKIWGYILIVSALALACVWVTANGGRP
jgi:hypothetical protein